MIIDYKGADGLKDAKLLVWLSQLALSTAAPLVGFILLSLWLHKRFALGAWVVVVGILLGLICAVEGFVSSLKAADKMRQEKTDPPKISFNEHE